MRIDEPTIVDFTLADHDHSSAATGGFLGITQATSIAVPAITTASGALTITPAAGSNLDVNLSTTGDLAINTNQLYVDTSTARVGIGTATPTAALHIKAGTATVNTAPLKFTSGTSLTTAEAGAIEFTTDDFFATITTGAARKAFILDDGARLTSGNIPIASTNGRLIDLTGAIPTANFPALTGDITTPGASLDTTLATVNSNVGSFGSSTSIPTFTVSGKGLITAASGNAVVAPAGTLTGTTLAAGVTGSSLTSVGTIASGVWNGTVVDVAHGGTGDATLTANGVLVGNGTGAIAATSVGNAGEVLTSNGLGLDPTFQVASGGLSAAQVSARVALRA